MTAKVIILKEDSPHIDPRDQRWFVDARNPRKIDVVSMITQELVATTETIEDAEYICTLHNRNLGPSYHG